MISHNHRQLNLQQTPILTSRTAVRTIVPRIGAKGPGPFVPIGHSDQLLASDLQPDGRPI
jgi:hypothetical protein